MSKVTELSADNPKALKGNTSLGLSGVSGSSRRLIPEPWKKKRSKFPWEKGGENKSKNGKMNKRSG